MNKRPSGWLNLPLYPYICFHVSRETTQLVFKWMNRMCQALCQGWGYKSEQKQTRPCPRGTSSLHITKVRKQAHTVFSLLSRETRYRITPWLNHVSFKSPEQGSPEQTPESTIWAKVQMAKPWKGVGLIRNTVLLQTRGQRAHNQRVSLTSSDSDSWS